MKRHKSLIFISHDHYHGLQLAQLIKKNAPKLKNLPIDIEGKKNYTINFYENDLLHHFYLEENIILPAVKGRNKEIDKLFNELINEHREIEKTVESLKENTNIEDITIVRFRISQNFYISIYCFLLTRPVTILP